MDFLHAMQDDEPFSAYLHPHDEKTISNVKGGRRLVLPVAKPGRVPFSLFSYIWDVILSSFVLAFLSHFVFTSRNYIFTFPQLIT